MSASQRFTMAAVAIAVTVIPALWLPVAARQTTDESAAVSYYKSGLARVDQGNYGQAMKDFDLVLASFSTSSVAPYAMLEKAKYELDVKRDPETARATAEGLIKKYATSDAASMAWIVSGRSRLAAGRAPGDLDAALADFEHVPLLSNRSDSVPESRYYGAETQRLAGHFDEAIARYREVALQYPRSIWAARAALGAAVCFSFRGTPAAAFDDLQRVRSRFPDTPEAAQALAWNTTLYRLLLRGSQPAYEFAGRVVAGPAGKLKDVVAVAVDRRDNLIVASQQAVLVFGPTGTPVRTVSFNEARGLFSDAAGTLVVMGKGGFQPEGGALVALSLVKPDGTPKRLEDLVAAVAVSTGDVLVGDADSKTILRFSSGGKPVGRFAPVRGDRLAINALDEVAALDRDGKNIAIIDRAGKTLRQIAEKGAGYEMRNPVDVAFDALGHLFVLDRGVGAVLVFDQTAKVISTFSIPDKAPGAFRGATAMALDTAGRIFIYDTHTERVQVYQ